MQLVVADTSPVNYLILIQYVEILPLMFEKIFIPAQVRDELTDIEAPRMVREWIVAPPAWLEVRSVSIRESSDGSWQRLGEGEKAAISLAMDLGAGLILMDERQGTAAARGRGLAVTGTVGILDLAAKKGIVDLQEAFDRLKRTSFRYPAKIMEELLRERKQAETKKKDL